MRPIALATRSVHKAHEIERILAVLELRVQSLSDLGLPEDPAEEGIEVFDTFRANALAKARYFAARLQRPTLADDSGLRVDALGGRPGVHTRRFSGRVDLDGEALDRANNQLLLEKLRGVPEAARTARYVCCAAAAWPDGRGFAALGSVQGRIATEPRGEGGFGYDPLFFVPDLGARFAEVSADVKDHVSHRARAFRALTAALETSPWPL